MIYFIVDDGFTKRLSFLSETKNLYVAFDDKRLKL